MRAITMLRLHAWRSYAGLKLLQPGAKSCDAFTVCLQFAGTVRYEVVLWWWSGSSCLMNVIVDIGNWYRRGSICSRLHWLKCDVARFALHLRRPAAGVTVENERVCMRCVDERVCICYVEERVCI